MNWVSLNSRYFKSIDYDAENQVLRIRTPRYISTYQPIFQHQYDAFVETSDQIFYYKYYIHPRLVSSRRTLPNTIALSLKITAAACLGLLVLTTELGGDQAAELVNIVPPSGVTSHVN